MSSATQLESSRSVGLCDVLSCLGRPAAEHLSLVICEVGMQWVILQGHHKDSFREVRGGALCTVGGAVLGPALSSPTATLPQLLCLWWD